MRVTIWKAVAAGLICLSAAPAASQSVKAGIDAWQRGDPAAAVAIWRPLAEAGDADASFNLGQAYRLGRGVALDLAAAQDWLERAARKDHVDGQTTLGLLLFENGNRIGGLRWLKQAADKGEPRAMLVYGTALFNGDGVPQDPVTAYAFISRAAAQGLAPAKTTLAQLDEIMPLEQRKKGLALAMQKAKAAGQKPLPKTVAKAEPPKKPAPKPAEPKSVVEKPILPPAPSATSGKWRIQLGAFSQRGSAQALYKKLSGAAPVAGYAMILVPAGGMTRLQVGPFESKMSAASACSALSKRGQPCFVVPAK